MKKRKKISTKLNFPKIAAKYVFYMLWLAGYWNNRRFLLDVLLFFASLSSSMVKKVTEFTLFFSANWNLHIQTTCLWNGLRALKRALTGQFSPLLDDLEIFWKTGAMSMRILLLNLCDDSLFFVNLEYTKFDGKLDKWLWSIRSLISIFFFFFGIVGKALHKLYIRGELMYFFKCAISFHSSMLIT